MNTLPNRWPKDLFLSISVSGERTSHRKLIELFEGRKLFNSLQNNAYIGVESVCFIGFFFTGNTLANMSIKIAREIA